MRRDDPVLGMSVPGTQRTRTVRQLSDHGGKGDAPRVVRRMRLCGRPRGSTAAALREVDGGGLRATHARIALRVGQARRLRKPPIPQLF